MREQAARRPDERSGRQRCWWSWGEPQTRQRAKCGAVVTRGGGCQTQQPSAWAFERYTPTAPRIVNSSPHPSSVEHITAHSTLPHCSAFTCMTSCLTPTLLSTHISARAQQSKSPPCKAAHWPAHTCHRSQPSHPAPVTGRRGRTHPAATRGPPSGSVGHCPDLMITHIATRTHACGSELPEADAVEAVRPDEAAAVVHPPAGARGASAAY